MKKYTVVYADFYGSQGASITKFLHIECGPLDLIRTVAEKVDWGNIWFIFDGHCEQTED